MQRKEVKFAWRHLPTSHHIFQVKSDALNDEEKRNVEVSSEYLPLEQEDASNPVVEEKNEMLEEFERRKRARMINVSTDDLEIKKDLRCQNLLIWLPAP